MSHEAQPRPEAAAHQAEEEQQARGPAGRKPQSAPAAKVSRARAAPAPSSVVQLSQLSWCRRLLHLASPRPLHLRRQQHPILRRSQHPPPRLIRKMMRAWPLPSSPLRRLHHPQVCMAQQCWLLRPAQHPGAVLPLQRVLLACRCPVCRAPGLLCTLRACCQVSSVPGMHLNLASFAWQARSEAPGQQGRWQWRSPTWVLLPYGTS